MKIREFIISKEMVALQERLAKLEEIGAPQVVIDGTRNTIDEMKTGKVKVGGESKLLETEFTEAKVMKGRGGKVYVQFDGKVNYFPQAKYGRYITLA